MSDLVLLSTSTSSLGTASTPSLGRYAAATAPNGANGVFMDDITTGEQDALTADYRAVVVWNNGPNSLNVKVTITGAPSQATVTMGVDTTAAAPIANILTVTSPANQTTAPSGIIFGGTTVTLGAIGAGEGKAFWIRRVAVGTAARTNDGLTIKAYSY